jgi:hypothetical protein
MSFLNMFLRHLNHCRSLSGFCHWKMYAYIANSISRATTASSEEVLSETVQFSFDKDAQKGVLSGYINKPGEYKFNVSGGCYGTQVSGQSGSKDFTIKVLPVDSVQELIKQKKYDLVIDLAESVLTREPENSEWQKVKASNEALNSK